jgi:hypothetical protein
MNDNEPSTTGDGQAKIIAGGFMKIMGVIMWTIVSGVVALMGAIYFSDATFVSICVVILGALLLPCSRNLIVVKLPILARLVYLGTILISAF